MKKRNLISFTLYFRIILRQTLAEQLPFFQDTFHTSLDSNAEGEFTLTFL